MEENGLGPILRDPMLALAADILDDIEGVRVANENRLRTLTTPAGAVAADGESYGHGLTIDNDGVKRLASLVAQMYCDSKALADLGYLRPPRKRGEFCCMEHHAIKSLETAVRAHPLWPWADSVKGLGAKQFARLLGRLGDPYWNDLHNRPRTLRELWAYCGFHVLDTGVAPARRRGQKSNWNEDARKRTWIIAASCIKVLQSPYRAVYEQTRETYTDATHQQPCVRCGPSGKPALPGSPLSPGHQHARAMRAMCKEILRGLWEESGRLHKEPS